MLELSPVGGGAIVECADDCGTISPGGSIGARFLYRFEGVLAVGGGIDHTRMRFVPEGSDASGTLWFTWFGPIARVYPIDSGPIEPYVQLGVGWQLVDSDLETRSRNHGQKNHGFSVPAAIGLDVYVARTLRVGAWLSAAPLFIGGARGGDAALEFGFDSPPPRPNLQLLWSAGIAGTYVVDLGR